MADALTSVRTSVPQGNGAGPGQAAAAFDGRRLDRLMDEHELDALLITSKHNIQYMLGGYRYFFYDYMDAHGLSRYLPILVYVKGRPNRLAYAASPMEIFELENGRFDVPHVDFSSMTTRQAAACAARQLRAIDPNCRRIGVEEAFLPVDAYRVLADDLPGTRIVDGTLALELSRAVKTVAELTLMREASDRVIDAMITVMSNSGEGTTKAELVDAMRREETDRGLVFEYCLANMGRSMNRAPSGQRWARGEVLALDSGGNFRGYIGDLCRVACLGEPDQELVDLLGEVEAIQQAARVPIKAGAIGEEIYARPTELLQRSSHRFYTGFVAHGMGIVSHEAPWLTDQSSVPYPAYHARRPLEAGMVISIETTMSHPERGFIKLEDTLAVTENGWEAFGDTARAWNRGMS